MNVASSVLDLIGQTPLVRLNSLTKGIAASVFVKMESRNPGGSVKDRIGIAMIEQAEREGKIKPGGLIIEPTSGNTGIGVALAARLKGYRCLFVMTDKASQERVRYLKAMGAEVLIVSSAAKASSPEYYFNTAKKLSEEIPNAFMLNQYDNPANPDIHTKTTGPEIWNDTNGTVTHFIAGIGTGGTITGTARYLKSMNPAIKIIAADPVGSCIRTFKETGRLVEALPYMVEGVGQERIPLNLDIDMLDDVMNVNDKESFMTARRLAREEGIFCGGSSGMNVAVALRVAKLLPKEAVVVAIICDTGERYLTKHHSDEWLQEKQLLDDEKVTVKTILNNKASGASTPGLVSANPAHTLEDALQLMSQYELSQLPVIENESLVGNIRENRLMARVIANRGALQTAVGEFMEPPAPIVDAHDDSSVAITLLKENTYVVVKEYNRISGVITRHDVISYL
ncbi:MAG: cysteine synthase [Candidatus Kapabacteria bacterium]|nr:cysteine synthase [Candidatus Kapabacteria bacterium]